MKHMKVYLYKFNSLNADHAAKVYYKPISIIPSKTYNEICKILYNKLAKILK